MHLGEADVVVGDEDDAQHAADRRVGVDHPRHVVGELYDQLGVVVGRRRLAGEELHPRGPVPLRVRADLVVERHRLDDVEELALVLVDALDLDVEDGVGVEPEPHAVAHEMREAVLVQPLHAGEGVLEGGVGGVLLQLAQRVDVVEELRADGVGDEPGQAGVALLQPAARGDAVGLVVDPVREHPVQILEQRLLQELGVHRRHAVDRVRADEGEVAHAHPPLAGLVDQADVADLGVGHLVLDPRRLQQAGVDLVDDLHVPRQQPLEERHRPALQRLGQKRVVGVGDRGRG